LISQSVSVFFHEGSIGDGFFKIQEMSHINDLLKKSGRGLQFSLETSEIIGSLMLRLLNQSGFERFQAILSILNLLANSNEFKSLASMDTFYPLSDKENQKVDKVIDYILSHYDKDIKLEEIAKVANYSLSAFCHFFKARTSKTFIQFLTEVRISRATKLLRNKDLNISQICYESGFNNVSNFNRQFKKRIGLSPTEYKYKYTEAEEHL